MTDPIPPERSMLRAVALVGAVLVAMALVVSLGRGTLDADPLYSRLIALADALVRGASPAAAYLLAALGLGRLARAAYRRALNPWAIQMGVGLALALTLSHGLAWSGVLCGAGGPMTARGMTIIGLGLLAHQLARQHMQRHITVTLAWPVMLAIPCVAVLLVAAASPPGWLWDSEFGGYDALSYHLQLPQEWFIRGSLHPLEHNVYSYLPSHVEAAFVHLGALMGVPHAPVGGSPHVGLVAGDGMALLACQYLHAGMAIIAAWLIASAAKVMLGRLHSGAGVSPATRLIPPLVAIIILATPWTIIVGSLAYNEMAMIALTAVAYLCAFESTLHRIARGALIGGLIGAASSAKPTALLMFAPSLALLIVAFEVASTDRRARTRVITGAIITLAPAAIAGTLMLCPWLIRNAFHGGNPVFPFLTSIFGHAHWTPEQVSRYTGAHAFSGTLFDRLSLMVMSDASDPAGARHRGMLHAQWLVFFPCAMLAGVIACVRPRTRFVAGVLVTGAIVQIFVWLFATHIQSRFLIPLLIHGGLLIALALAPSRDQTQSHSGKSVAPPSTRRIAAQLPIILACIIITVQTIGLIVIFAGQRGGMPNHLLAGGPPRFSGEFVRESFAAASPEQQRQFIDIASPEIVLNLLMPPPSRVSLIGTATPLYIRPPVYYATTWDLSPLAEVMRGAPSEPESWTRTLRALRITAVLIDASELERLHRSGWLDPALDPTAIAAWLSQHATPVRTWPEAARAIYFLREPERAP